MIVAVVSDTHGIVLPVAYSLQRNKVDVDFDAAAQQTAKTGKLVLTFAPDGFLDAKKSTFSIPYRGIFSVHKLLLQRNDA